MDKPCCDRAYFCPTVGENECGVHGGFSVCCSHPELHESLQPNATIDPERIRAALRMLLDSGDITPMGVRMIERVLSTPA